MMSRSIHPHSICLVFLILSLACIHQAHAQSSSLEVIRSSLKTGNYAELRKISKQKLPADQAAFLAALLTTNGDSAALLFDSMMQRFPDSPLTRDAGDRVSLYDVALTFDFNPAPRLPENKAKQDPIPVPEANSQGVSVTPSAEPETTHSAPPSTAISRPDLPKVTPPNPATLSGKGPFPASPSEPSGFRLQFGSFRDKKGAQRFAEVVKGQKVIVVESRDNSGNPLYKVKSATLYPTRDEAKKAAASIKLNSFVSPEE